jgi:hypothetical protein
MKELAMLNSRTKWVLALLVIFLVTLACSKKEEAKTEETKQAAPTEQKSTPMEQAKEQTAAGSTAASDRKAVYQNTCAPATKRASQRTKIKGTERPGTAASQGKRPVGAKRHQQRGRQCP